MGDYDRHGRIDVGLMPGVRATGRGVPITAAASRRPAPPVHPSGVARALPDRFAGGSGTGGAGAIGEEDRP
ncbi:hypothetical protein [Saccharothrix longispora]|uniref:hypothetical protein n=1 Tax=Saccharothrix longispora TaxID=33920 RepID=UPI0028FDAB9E|nr:hypothetical protein [Saccharothrix longispora]MBY8849361.1 hypothetical protein [Saccharothrix sp. MB29]MDU0288143.1 hypothetical protein [Saccharothrix longispora]